MNGKIKSVCSWHANLSQIFYGIFAVLSNLCNEQDHQTIMALLKTPAVIPNNEKNVFRFADSLCF